MGSRADLSATEVIRPLPLLLNSKRDHKWSSFLLPLICLHLRVPVYLYGYRELLGLAICGPKGVPSKFEKLWDSSRLASLFH